MRSSSPAEATCHVSRSEVAVTGAGESLRLASRAAASAGRVAPAAAPRARGGIAAVVVTRPGRARRRRLLPRGYGFAVAGIAVGMAGLVALGALADRISRFIDGGHRFVLGQISVAGAGLGTGAGFTAGGLLPPADHRGDPPRAGRRPPSRPR